jgi:hypothetical protein
MFLLKVSIVAAVLIALNSYWIRYASEPVVFEGSILITGASAGIGRAAAFYLAKKNFHVFPSYRQEVSMFVRASVSGESKKTRFYGFFSCFVAPSRGSHGRSSQEGSAKADSSGAIGGH